VKIKIAATDRTSLIPGLTPVAEKYARIFTDRTVIVLVMRRIESLFTGMTGDTHGISLLIAN